MAQAGSQLRSKHLSDESSQRSSPGRALEIGVGHGRNAIFLAKQRWDATGFDVADKA